jgi:hypothetical protein
VNDEHVDVSALVLGHIDWHRRGEAVAHLLACPTCRAEYDEMAATLGELLPAVPEMQPPLGFDQHALARMGIGRTRARGALQRRLLTAAAAVLIVVLGAVGWWATTRDTSTAVGHVVALELVNGGSQVGTVSVGDVKGETVMVVALVDPPEGVSYRCRTTFSDGTVTESEPWPDGYGAWIVPLPGTMSGQVDSIELVVDGTDHVWSAASFID